LVIDRPILELLKIDPETLLDITTDGKQLIVTPAKPSARRKKFEAAQELAHKRYGQAFRKLAEWVPCMEPAFLSLDEILEIHEKQIERYGGSASLRDPAG
jgi:antitoxin MazE